MTLVLWGRVFWFLIFRAFIQSKSHDLELFCETIKKFRKLIMDCFYHLFSVVDISPFSRTLKETWKFRAGRKEKRIVTIKHLSKKFNSFHFFLRTFFTFVGSLVCFLYDYNDLYLPLAEIKNWETKTRAGNFFRKTFHSQKTIKSVCENRWLMDFPSFHSILEPNFCGVAICFYCTCGFLPVLSPLLSR